MKHTPRRLTSSIRVALLAAAAALLALALPAAATALPSDRAYEMVSPPDKNDGEVGAGNFRGAFRAAADGAWIAYSSVGGWGDTLANGIAAGYLGTRGESGWSSHGVMLPLGPPMSLGGGGPTLISRDGTAALVTTNRDPDTGEDVGSGLNAPTYIVDTGSLEAEPFLGTDVDGDIVFGPSSDAVGGNADLSKTFFSANGGLTADAPPSGQQLYRRVNGEITYAGYDPTGAPATSRLARGGVGYEAERPVSADGNIVLFTGGSNFALYRRDYTNTDSPQTELVNASENSTEVVPEGQAQLGGASADGSIVYFLSDQKLVDADTDTQRDLYRWDASEPDGSRLTLVSVDGEAGDADGRVTDVYRTSSDGERVIFASPSQLVAGAPTDAGSKLYVWDATDGLRYIGLTGGRADVVISENGDYIGILTGGDLTGDNDTVFAQVYLHDYVDDETSCVSCRPGAEVNSAEAMWRQRVNLVFFSPGDIPLRNVSNDGDVFFETTEGLLPNDTNNKYDVYAWKDGVLDMLSTGRSGDDSFFADADASGDNAFFYTREQLSGWDVDNRRDLYDARVGGGLPEPPTPTPPCTGDDCQGDVSGDPGYESPGTSTYEGEGNKPAKAGRCQKAERRSNRLERRAKQLKRKANRARSNKRTRRLNRRAKRVSKKARKASRRATRCNRRAQS